ncbi:MAG: response regulator [Chloroflexi bacterium]|nr:response regulator [Chloroflexota bacterium]
MRYKLLVIDDHPETLNIISKVLRQQGYVVVASNSGTEGLSLLESEMPDLILVDGMMPKMDGWEFCRQVRANPDVASTPIIMFSAINEAEQKLAGLDAGADDYLTKPTEPIELSERVTAILEGVTPRNKLPEDPELPPLSSEAQFETGTAMVPADNSHLIGILGVRGGVGTTLLAINLAASLAMQEQDTVLIDLDVLQGHVGLYLHQTKMNSLNELSQLPEGMIQDEAAQYLSAYSKNLQLLLTEPNLLKVEKTPTAAQVTEILESLARPERFLVADCGQGITAVNRPVIEQADELIICVRPERVALGIAKQFINQVQEMIFPHTRLQALLIDYSGHLNVPRQAIESYIGHPIIAIIPVTPQELNRAVNKSVPLVQLIPDSKASGLISQLAHQVANG